jgi:PAS domain S-box-containing protein
VSAKGVRKWIRTIGHPVVEDGRVVAVIGSLQDISDRRRTESQLRQSAERLAVALDAAQMGTWDWDLRTGCVEWSTVQETLCGFAPGTFPGTNDAFIGRVHPEDAAALMRIGEQAVHSRAMFRGEYRVTWPDGSVHWLATHGRYTFDDAGNPERLGGVTFDITEHKRADTALRESDERLRLFIEHAPAALAMFDQRMRYLSASRRWRTDYGLGDSVLVGRSHYEIFPEIGEGWKAVHRRGLAGEVVREEEDRFVRADGSVQYLRWEVRPWFESSGRVGGIIIATEDITVHKEDELALRESEERFRSLVEGAPEAVFVQTDGFYRYVNRAMIALAGATGAGDLLGRRAFEFVAPEYHEVVRRRIADQRLGIVAPPMEQEHLRLDGSRVPVETTAVAIRFQGRDGHLVFVRDISERRKAQADHARLEAELHQAQKLEAIGRLAGGVAHDFNNLLLGIMSHADLCRDAVETGQPARHHLDAIIDAAQRSAAITRQLLGFARRQTIAPVILDLNDHVAETLKLLRRLISEEIELAWLPKARRPTVRMDPSQVDQLLANLLLNARDAISGVGRITIETGVTEFDEAACAGHQVARPGPYVMLAISDSGCGMDAATRAQIFEPFFTTKPVGEGTGLGLATVYGIVRQNDGFVTVDSEPGQGTAFRLYFRRHFEALEDWDAASLQAAPVGGTETILLVEDESAVRVTTGLVLRGLGYTVLMAESPEEALGLMAEDSRAVDLLITDVVMPTMNGRDLAARLAEGQPGMRCLFISGYPADVISRQGVLDPGVHFLAKPFSRADLASKIREALGGRP